MKRILAWVFLVGLPPFALAQFPYDIIDLGSFGGEVVWPHAINNKGHVVGYALDSTGETRAFFWANGVMTDLGTLGDATYHEANAINELDQVAGNASDDFGGHSFLWENGTLTSLSGSDTVVSVPYGINNSGKVVGLYYPKSVSIQQGFLWESSLFTDLGSLSSSEPFTQARGINNSDQIVGYSAKPTGGNSAFRWENGTMMDLGPIIGGANSEGFAINDSGHIAGDYNDTLGTSPFLLKNGVSVTLDTLLQGYAARSVNIHDQVIGFAQGGANPFVWENGVTTFLNDAVDPDSGWQMFVTDDINDNGEIIAFGLHNGKQRGALLRPHGLMTSAGAIDQPEEFTLHQNYPNPFNPTTNIEYTVAAISGQLSAVSRVRLVIYDLLGREVKTLVDETKTPGTYRVTVDGSGLASGVYICRLAAGGFSQSIKMVLLR